MAAIQTAAEGLVRSWQRRKSFDLLFFMPRRRSNSNPVRSDFSAGFHAFLGVSAGKSVKILFFLGDSPWQHGALVL